MVEQFSFRHENPNNHRLSNNLSCGLNTVKLKRSVTVLWHAKMVVVKLEKNHAYVFKFAHVEIVILAYENPRACKYCNKCYPGVGYDIVE